jgi:hypothetical protein
MPPCHEFDLLESFVLEKALLWALVVECKVSPRKFYLES